MKRKTTATPKIPSEKGSPKSAGTKGILAFAAPNPSSSPKANTPSPSATRNANISLAPKPNPLTPFQGPIEEWLTYCKASGLFPKPIITSRFKRLSLPDKKSGGSH